MESFFQAGNLHPHRRNVEGTVRGDVMMTVSATVTVTMTHNVMVGRGPRDLKALVPLPAELDGAALDPAVDRSACDSQPAAELAQAHPFMGGLAAGIVHDVTRHRYENRDRDRDGNVSHTARVTSGRSNTSRRDKKEPPRSGPRRPSLPWSPATAVPAPAIPRPPMSAMGPAARSGLATMADKVVPVFPVRGEGGRDVEAPGRRGLNPTPGAKLNPARKPAPALARRLDAEPDPG